VWQPQDYVIEVSEKKRMINTESFVDVAEKGTDDDVLKFIQSKNILKSESKFDPFKIYWRLQNKEFY